MTRRRTIHLRSRVSELDRLEQALREFAAEHGASAEDLAKANLVLEELLTNVATHAGGGEHRIRIELRLEGRDLWIDWRDDGAPFDPSQAPLPDTEAPLVERAVGGLGLHLVRTFAEELHYDRDGEENVLRIRAGHWAR